MSRIRLLPTFLIAILTLSVLLGGWFAYRSYALVNPLVSRLNALSSVQNAKVLVDNSGNRDVIIDVGRVADLQSTYDEISGLVNQYLGSAAHIDFKDRRDAALTDTYRNIQPMIFEAIANGKYTWLFQNINQHSFGSVSAKVSMDETYIYLQLEQGTHYLYVMVPYHDHQEVNAS